MCRNVSHVSCLALCLGLGVSAEAARIYVDVDATGANNGSSWTDAYTSLPTALTGRSAGDEVWVAEGTYSNITLVDGVKLYGGFYGNETSASQSNPDVYVTIISGGGQTRAIESTNDSSSTVVRGFHIIDGVNPGSLDEGAGVLLTNSSPTFVRCVFRDNVFSYMGGAVANMGDGSPRFVNCKFYHNNRYIDAAGNESGFAGAALYNRDGSPTLVNCLFYENTAMEAGAIASVTGVVTLINCTLADNKSTIGNGGAMYDHRGNAVVRNCIFWNNDAVKYGTDEIFNSSGTTAVSYTDIKGGHAGTGNINSDPKFVNPGADDYKIGGPSVSPSPCKDAGSDPLVPADFGDLDWDGNTTEQTPLDLTGEVNGFSRNRVDMGAYEWTPSEQ